MIELNRGKPTVEGVYVVYIESAKDPSVADREFLQWAGERWNYPATAYRFRGRVLRWAGPLPAVYKSGGW